MTISICEAISRTNDNGIIINKAYYLLVKSTTNGEIFIQTIPKCNSEMMYGNIHDFLKDWQNITCYGYAKTELDLRDLINNIKNNSLTQQNQDELWKEAKKIIENTSLHAYISDLAINELKQHYTIIKNKP